MVWFVLWLILAGPVWGFAGSRLVLHRYRSLDLDTRRASLAGGLVGLAFGPLGVGYLYQAHPDLEPSRFRRIPPIVAVLELWLIFRVVYPDNPCNTSGGYVANQLQNGLTIGLVFAAMAVGLSLIYSVQGIISFAHGQFFLFGGVLAFLLVTEVWEVNSVFAVPVIGLIALILGMLFEATMLAPMHGSKIERKGEYAILVTFGFGLFLQFAVVSMLGNPVGVRSPRYTEGGFLGFHESAYDVGPLRIRTDLLIAGLIGIVLLIVLAWFLQRTWTGRSFRAVAQQPEAASVVGINSGRTFTLAFGIGTSLAAMAGAALVPALNFPVPQMAGQVAIRSYVIIVLGGLGSVVGAGLGGLSVGVAESAGAGCFPDAGRASSYQLAFPLIMFAIVLLTRPTGLFGRDK